LASRESGSAIKAGKIAQPGQPEPVSCDAAGGVAGFAGVAHVRPLAIDDAPCFDTDLSHQSGTSIPMAPHSIQTFIDKLTRDAAQIVLILHREPRPVPRVRATGPAGITTPNRETRVRFFWRHTVYPEPQFGGAVSLDQVAATAFEVRNAASPCSRCAWLLLPWMAMVRPSLRGGRRWRSLLCFLLLLRPLEHPRTARVLSARRGQREGSSISR
jgi:hypothetical protein